MTGTGRQKCLTDLGTCYYVAWKQGACQLESTPVNPCFCPAGEAHLLRIELGPLSRCEAPTDPAKIRPQVRSDEAFPTRTARERGGWGYLPHYLVDTWALVERIYAELAATVRRDGVGMPRSLSRYPFADAPG